MKLHCFYFGDNTCLYTTSNWARNIKLEHYVDKKNIKNTLTLQIPEVIPYQKKPMGIATPCYKHTYVPSKENTDEQ